MITILILSDKSGYLFNISREGISILYLKINLIMQQKNVATLITLSHIFIKINQSINMLQFILICVKLPDSKSN